VYLAYPLIRISLRSVVPVNSNPYSMICVMILLAVSIRKPDCDKWTDGLKDIAYAVVVMHGKDVGHWWKNQIWTRCHRNGT